MTPEKDALLRERYPKIFRISEAEKDSFSVWGFECLDGWFDIIDCLCRNIQHHIDWRSEQISAEDLEDLQVVAIQVKEKFGTLRFYYNGGDEKISGMVSVAEEMSSRICEICGNSGKTGTKAWARTLCDSCRDAKDKK